MSTLLSKRQSMKKKNPENVFRRRLAASSRRKAPCIVKTEKLKFSNNSCRICLNEGDILIFNDENLGDLSETIFNITGVKVLSDDLYPKYLCHTCHEKLQKANILREQAQKTNILLEETPQSDAGGISDFDNDEEYNQPLIKLNTKKKSIFKDTLEDAESKFHCTKCELDFKDSDDYAEHVFTIDHKNVGEYCPFCHRSFKCIVRHLTLHKINKTMLCDVCGQKFLQTSFFAHRESHFDKLRFKCEQCPYEGRFGADFRIHMRKHTGERPYKCTECQREFISKSNLNRHAVTHKKEYNFHCQLCDRSYFYQRDLDNHMVTHTNARPHQCDLCDKAFPLRKGLMRHTLKVHKRDKLMSGRTPNYVRIQAMKHDKEFSKI